MSKSNTMFSIEVEGAKAVCPLGEVVGDKMIAEGKIPVISCEGGCFRGEIARVAAHMVAIGETVGKRNIREKRIPVLSCEGGCIRGEIARLAANMVSKESGFARGCHGELVTVPDSAIAQWIRGAEKVILIDGCFLRCHGRILEGLLKKDQLVQFDALKVYRDYTDVFDIDEVPEAGRKKAARQVAGSVLVKLVHNRPGRTLKRQGATNANRI